MMNFRKFAYFFAFAYIQQFVKLLNLVCVYYSIIKAAFTFQFSRLFLLFAITKKDSITICILMHEHQKVISVQKAFKRVKQLIFKNKLKYRVNDINP